MGGAADNGSFTFVTLVFADRQEEEGGRVDEAKREACFYFEELHISEYAYWSMSCNFHI